MRTAMILVTLLSLGVSMAWAQPGRGGFGRGGSDPLSLLNNPRVQEELEIASDQKEKLESLSREMREEMMKEIQALQQKLRQKYQGRMDDILLPHQTDRLQQLRIQLGGTQVLNDDDIAKELNITESQKEQMTAIRDSMRDKMREMFRNRDSGVNPREEIPRMLQQAQEDILNVLSAKQREAFEKMKGAEVDASEFRRSRFGRRGGEGGRRGPGRPDGDREERPSEEEEF